MHALWRSLVVNVSIYFRLYVVCIQLSSITEWACKPQLASAVGPPR
jgi:hypothetical protein